MTLHNALKDEIICEQTETHAMCHEAKLNDLTAIVHNRDNAVAISGVSEFIEDIHT